MKVLLSIVGLYNHDETIFNPMVLPESIDRDTLIDNILMQAGELPLVYPDADLMKRLLLSWSNRKIFQWNRMEAVQELEYNPIENYDRTETETITATTTDTGTITDASTSTVITDRDTTDTRTPNTAETKSVTGFNSNNLVSAEKYEQTGTETGAGTEDVRETGNGNNTKTLNTSQGENRSRQLRNHGNIGITTTQQMMSQELDILDRLDLYQVITDDFIDAFCVGVY